MFSKKEVSLILKTQQLNNLESLLHQFSQCHTKSNEVDISKGRFPKECTSCGKVFKSTGDFENQTVNISEDLPEVCYRIRNEIKIYRYRNCPPPCGSTLVYVTNERRDTSELGKKRRKLFDQVKDKLLEIEPGLSQKSGHALTLYLTRMICYEGMDPIEALKLMVAEIKSGRFRGYDACLVRFENLDDIVS